MGTGGQDRQGLHIRKRLVSYTPDAHTAHKGTLVKYSEIRMLVNDFAHEADSAIPYSQAVHDHGVTIAMSFHKAHAPEVAWAAAAPGYLSPDALSYTPLARNPGIETILKGMFKTDGTWFGYVIGTSQFPTGNNVMYIRTTIDPFMTNHERDVHIVPVLVVIGTSGDFATHYALGVATFTQGEAFFTFDSQVLSDAQ
jgi:hypothetical protein